MLWLSDSHRYYLERNIFPGTDLVEFRRAEIFGSYTGGRWHPMELKIQTGEDGSCQPGQLSCSFDMKNGDWQFGFFRSTLSYVYGPPEQILCSFPTEGDRRAISFIYDDTTKQIIVQQVENCWDLPGRQNRNAIGYIGPKDTPKQQPLRMEYSKNPCWTEWWRYHRTSLNTYSCCFMISRMPILPHRYGGFRKKN